jgi:putative flippase GtrA
MAVWRVFGPVDSDGRSLDWKRLRRAARRKENWAQLTIFCLVGASGYVVNVALFAVYVDGLRFDPRIGALLAFLCAVGNNFVWNRRWTFPGRDAGAGRQAIKFAMVSVGAFLVSLAVLSTLVSLTDVPVVVSQMIAIAIATPVGFVGNKVWTFRGADTTIRPDAPA